PADPRAAAARGPLPHHADPLVGTVRHGDDRGDGGGYPGRRYPRRCGTGAGPARRDRLDRRVRRGAAGAAAPGRRDRRGGLRRARPGQLQRGGDGPPVRTGVPGRAGPQPAAGPAPAPPDEPPPARRTDPAPPSAAAALSGPHSRASPGARRPDRVAPEAKPGGPPIGPRAARLRIPRIPYATPPHPAEQDCRLPGANGHRLRRGCTTPGSWHAEGDKRRGLPWRTRLTSSLSGWASVARRWPAGWPAPACRSWASRTASSAASARTGAVSRAR